MRALIAGVTGAAIGAAVLMGAYARDPGLAFEMSPGLKLPELLFEILIQTGVPGKETPVEKADGELGIILMLDNAIRHRMH